MAKKTSLLKAEIDETETPKPSRKRVQRKSVKPVKKATKKTAKKKSVGKKSTIPKEDTEDTLPPRKAEKRANSARWAQQQSSRLMTYAETSKAVRDIWPIPLEDINWEVRNACRKDLRLFLKTYFPRIFYLRWSVAQNDMIERMETVMYRGGLFCVAVPRGEGKTAIGQCSTIWAAVYGHRRYIYFIGDEAGSAEDALHSIKTELYTNPQLIRDFPEHCYPIARLENRGHSAKGQLCRGVPTFIEWSNESVVLPCVTFDKEHFDPADMLELPDKPLGESNAGLYCSKSAGTVIRCKGITGGVKGAIHKHPLTGELMRPDVFIADDVQTDKTADSPASTHKIIRYVEGALEGLSGPQTLISGVMLCTVAREGDVSETFLDKQKRPQWHGQKTPMVLEWPDGVGIMELNPETLSGQHWMKYDELRRVSLRMHGDITLASEYYLENQEEMDAGFRMSWEDRFNGDEKLMGMREYSAIQHAMNLRLSKPVEFSCEYQQEPYRESALGTRVLTPALMQQRIVSVERNILTAGEEHLVAYIDVQDEILWYVVMAVSNDFTGHVVDYGTFPKIDRLYITKAETEKWCLLSKLYFERNPGIEPIGKASKSSMPKAQFEGKIYLAIDELLHRLLGTTYLRDDGAEFNINRIGIDCQWGSATKPIYRLIRNRSDSRIIPCHGKYIGVGMLKFHEWQIRPGNFLGDYWLFSTSKYGVRYLLIDTNHWKTFLWNRFTLPIGSPSSLTVFQLPAERHEMYFDHLCKSEYPETKEARGQRLDEWKEYPGKPDNDLFDASVGCAVLASLCGSRVNELSPGTTPNEQPKTRRKKWSEVWKEKRNMR